MHVRSGTIVVSLIRANWRGYSWRQLELSPDFQSTNTEYLYRETCWERLEERRTRRKLQLLYNIKNGSTPSYLLDLIPPTIQSTTIYLLRNGNDIIVPFCRLDSYQILKSCSINISDCLKYPGTCDSSPCITTCKIQIDKNNTCKTCGMLTTSPEFTSNLTGKTYYTKSLDSLDCSTKNIIYWHRMYFCVLVKLVKHSQVE
jgi:hypothetical protein